MTSSETITKTKIAIVALGYVGLPIAMAFGKIGQCFGYDNNFKRIDSLKNGEDWTKQFSTSELKSTSVHFTSDLSEIKNCNFSSLNL